MHVYIVWETIFGSHLQYVANVDRATVICVFKTPVHS